MSDKTLKLRATLDVSDVASKAKKISGDLNKVTPGAKSFGNGGPVLPSAPGESAGTDSRTRRELANAVGLRGIAGIVAAKGLAVPGVSNLVGAGVALLGTVGIIGSLAASLINLQKSFARANDEAVKYGLTIQEGAKLSFAERSTGADQGALLGATARLRELQIKAGTGDQGARETLANAGISQTGQASAEVLKIGQGLRSGAVSYFQAAEAIGTDALEALQNGADRAAASFDDLNSKLSPETRKRLEDEGRSLYRVGAQLTTITHDVLGKLASNFDFGGIEDLLKGNFSFGGYGARLLGQEAEEPKSAAQLAAEQAAYVKQQRDLKARDQRFQNDQDEIEAIQKKLPLQRQLNELINQRNQLEAYRRGAGSQDALTSEETRRAILGVNEQIDATRQSLLKTPNAPVPSADALQRIGLFRGGVPVETVAINQQQLAELRRIAQRLAELPAGIASRL